MTRLAYLLIVLAGLNLQAQQPTADLEMELESIAEAQEEGTLDLLQLAEELQQLKQQGVALNYATLDELLRLPGINIFQAANLLRYRELSGTLYSPYELLAVKGFDREMIQSLSPYLDFSTKPRTREWRPRRLWQQGRHNLLLRSGRTLQQQAGYQDNGSSHYLGPAMAHYGRYRFNYRNQLSAGLLFQHDAGEPLGGSQQSLLFDHWSGYLALHQLGRWQKLIVGDFQAEFGQGLALWSGLSFGKSAQTTDIKRYPRGLRPFSGGEENRFLRGLAAQYRLADGWVLSAFYSRHRQDAGLSATDSSGEFRTGSLRSSGLHRSTSELATKHRNRLQTAGAHLSRRGEAYALGLTAVHYQLALPLDSGNALYQRYRFQGDQLANFSLDANYLFADLNLFGEVASDQEGHLAYVIGVQSNPADALYLSLLHRQFDFRYQSLYTAPFAENGGSGEQGTYLALNWQILRKLELKAFVDVYRFAWARFGSRFPSQGEEFLLQLESALSSRMKGYIRFRKENDERDLNTGEALTRLAGRSRQYLRLHLSYRLSPQLKLAQRVEHSWYRHGTQREQGLLIFQDVSWQFARFPLKVEARLALADVSDFSARIYAYERDLLYSFSIPAYYGQSQRSYLMLSYSWSRRGLLQVRYAQTRFFDRSHIGSGGQTIEGKWRSELQAQLRLTF